MTNIWLVTFEEGQIFCASSTLARAESMLRFMGAEPTEEENVWETTMGYQTKYFIHKVVMDPKF